MITVYLAIMNDGWMRSEYLFLTPRMMRTKGVDIVLQNPLDTWDVPIPSNRNEIRRRFLDTGRDYLVMLDNDCIPQHNPIELVFKNKDIIGCPQLARQNGEIIWTVWNRVDGRLENVDLDKLENPPELLPVDVIAGNCIIIKRCVLESLIFEDVFNEDGKRIRGEDIEFCCEAKKLGFEVYTAPKRRCEHIKYGKIKKQCKE